MNKLLVVGGQQRRDAVGSDEWFHYERAVGLEISLPSGSVRPVLSHITPPHLCAAENAAITFKAGTIQGDRLYLCTQTEIFIYALPSYRLEHSISHPYLNDVHHVRPTENGTLLVANTGLDQILELSLEGQVLREWPCHDVDTWTRFDRNIDYRKVITTKPHQVHPNYLSSVGNELRITRFQQQDSVVLPSLDRPIPLPEGRPHDGIAVDDRLIFTTVNGWVIEVDARTGTRLRTTNLNELAPREETLGWCRGIAAEGESVWVGFSRLRPTKFRENISWIKHGFQRVGIYNTLPTRISLYDLKRRVLMREVELESEQLNAVFSILPLD